MPIYEYRCSHCSEPFERWQSFDDPAPPCPRCGAAEVTRLISAFQSAGGSGGEFAAPTSFG